MGRRLSARSWLELFMQMSFESHYLSFRAGVCTENWVDELMNYRSPATEDEEEVVIQPFSRPRKASVRGRGQDSTERNLSSRKFPQFQNFFRSFRAISFGSSESTKSLDPRLNPNPINCAFSLSRSNKPASLPEGLLHHTSFHSTSMLSSLDESLSARVW